MPTTNEQMFPCFPRQPRNDMLCYFCLEADDDLIFCDGFCCKSYCRECLGFQAVPQGDFFCPYCCRNLLRCDICKHAGAYNREVFKCCFCSYACHPYCAGDYESATLMPIYIRDDLGVRRREWVCCGCAVSRPHCFRCCGLENFVAEIDNVNFCDKCWGADGGNAIRDVEWGK